MRRSRRLPASGAAPASPRAPSGASPGGLRGSGARSEAGRIGSVRTAQTGALEALLVDLGSQIHLGASLATRETAEAARWLCSGVPELDARLGGGFPIGRLSEICGPASSGRTALALSLLAETLSKGVLGAWVDLADAFDPASAAEGLRGGGSDLERLLWVRARTEEEALKSCERLLQTEGFELVVLDCAHEPCSRLSIPDASWLRLARLAAATRTALITLAHDSLTGSRAELVLEMQPLAARFVGPPGLLDAIETTAVLRRHRSRPTGQIVALSVDVEPTPRLEPSVDVEPRRSSAEHGRAPVRARRPNR